MLGCMDKDGAEGNKLKAYLKDLYSACLGADSDISVQIVTSYWIGPLHKGNRNPRDILVQFVHWVVKSERRVFFGLHLA